MIERAYQQLETAGYSRTTPRTLRLVLARAFGEQTGRTIGAHKPRETDDLRPVWTLAEARAFLNHIADDRLYPLWRLLLTTGLRRAELCGLQWCDLEPDLAALTVQRQRVVEDPTSRVRDKPPKSHNGNRTQRLHRHRRAAREIRGQGSRGSVQTLRRYLQPLRPIEDGARRHLRAPSTPPAPNPRRVAKWTMSDPAPIRPEN